MNPVLVVDVTARYLSRILILLKLMFSCVSSLNNLHRLREDKSGSSCV